MNLAVPFAGWSAQLPSRKAVTHAARVAAICAAFVAMLVSGFQHRRDLGELLRAAMARPAFLAGMAQAGHTGVLRPHDPRSGFVETPIGLLLFASLDSDICRRVLFDNRTGFTAEAGRISCGQQPDQPVERLGVERMLAMSKAFRK